MGWFLWLDDLLELVDRGRQVLLELQIAWEKLVPMLEAGHEGSDFFLSRWRVGSVCGREEQVHDVGCQPNKLASLAHKCVRSEVGGSRQEGFAGPQALAFGENG